MSQIDTFSVQYQMAVMFRDGILAGLSDDDGYFQAAPGLNPITWHAAHAARVNAGVLLGAGAGQKDLFPAGWDAWYGRGVKLPENIRELPPLSAVVAQLAPLDAKILAFVNSLDPARLDEVLPYRPATMPDFLKTFADCLARMPIHMAHHHGEMMVLRRILGKPNLR